MMVDLTHMEQRWRAERASDHGRSILHMGVDNRPYVYVNIPKNASSWLKDQIDGTLFNYVTDSIPDSTYIIVLRDPIERWISGAAQSFIGCSTEDDYFFLNIGFNAIFDQILFDEHTAPQKAFLKDINFENVVWFRCDENLDTNWNNWAKDKITTATVHNGRWHNEDNPYNVSSKGLTPNQFPSQQDKSKNVAGWTQQRITNVLREHLNTCPKHVEQLKWYYRKCYKLINSVKFYEAR
jgi:hypothetical protein